MCFSDFEEPQVHQIRIVQGRYVFFYVLIETTLKDKSISFVPSEDGKYRMTEYFKHMFRDAE